MKCRGAKEFGTFRTSDGVSFGIHDNEFFALLEPSCCGKTTLLRIWRGSMRRPRGRSG